ncbi:MAG: segregation/condensation protein A [Myxococcota bacterium]
MFAPEAPLAGEEDNPVEAAPEAASDASTPPDEGVRELLGPDLRVPVEVIPKGYQPSDSVRDPMFQVELDAFAGPLDLLLYLIRQHDVDVLNIPIKFLTARYLQVLEDLRALQIDVASEFLVLAAELTHIKSKMLLPAREGVADEDEDEGDAEDPRAELVRRLLEYQKYRDAAVQLDDRDLLGRDVFPRVPPVAEDFEALDAGLKSVSVFRLVELMASMLRKAPPAFHEISFEQYSVAERIHYVLAFGDARTGQFDLGELLSTIESRAELVVTFISVLEMTKLGLVTLFAQDEEISAHAETTDPEAPLPTILIRMTGKRFEGGVEDDYLG